MENISILLIKILFYFSKMFRIKTYLTVVTLLSENDFKDDTDEIDIDKNLSFK